MYLYLIGVIKDTNLLPAPAIIPVNYRINDSLTQHLDGILGDINPLPSFDARSYSDVPIKKRLGAIYQILERPRHDFTISIPTGPNRFSKQHTHHLTLRDMVLWVLAEEEYAGIRRNDCPISHLNSAPHTNQRPLDILETTGLPTRGRTPLDESSHLFQIKIFHGRVIRPFKLPVTETSI